MTCDSLNTERTAEQYVRGVVNMELGDEIIANILLDRHVSPDYPVSDLDLRTKMLLKADVYMACSAMPSVAVSVDDADGNWRHKEGAVRYPRRTREDGPLSPITYTLSMERSAMLQAGLVCVPEA